ncbi:MAG: phosphatidate cytidylyltransferase [Pseudobacteriovorax sp.]|nr:phosphatidate cytidylyltransferase [Pseudobacteriovorax sp.]
MLKQRVMTAALALPALLAFLVFSPNWVLIPFFTSLVGISAFELAHMLGPKLETVFSKEKESLAPVWLTPVAVTLSCLIFLGSSVYSPSGGKGLVLFGLLGGILIGAFCAPDNDRAFGRIVAILLAVVYGAFPWLATWDLYVIGDEAYGDGSRMIIFLCSIVWAGDTGAYFGGKRFGRHKLAPRMSPKKTWEGSFFGMVASIIGAVVCNIFYGFSIGSWAAVLLAGILGGVFGQMGDLVESTFKRFSGIKDSGIIFPGHGGFLDRVDGLMFAAPVVWFVLYSFKPLT